MKKIERIFSTLMLVGICVFASAFNSLAGYSDIYILPNQAWTGDFENTDSRSTAYSTVHAKLNTVYPESGTDFFTKIQVRVTNGYGLVISDIYTLTEGKDVSAIPIKEGYLDTTFVGFAFRGNSSASAYASVYYSGR